MYQVRMDGRGLTNVGLDGVSVLAVAEQSRLRLVSSRDSDVKTRASSDDGKKLEDDLRLEEARKLEGFCLKAKKSGMRKEWIT
jgi:hypothetical protein